MHGSRQETTLFNPPPYLLYMMQSNFWRLPRGGALLLGDYILIDAAAAFHDFTLHAQTRSKGITPPTHIDTYKRYQLICYLGQKSPLSPVLTRDCYSLFDIIQHCRKKFTSRRPHKHWDFKKKSKIIAKKFGTNKHLFISLQCRTITTTAQR